MPHLWPAYSASNRSLCLSAHHKVPHFRVSPTFLLHNQFARRPRVLQPYKLRICSSTASSNFLLSKLYPPFIFFSYSRPRRAPHPNLSHSRPFKSCSRMFQTKIFRHRLFLYPVSISFFHDPTLRPLFLSQDHFLRAATTKNFDYTSSFSSIKVNQS